MERYANEVKRLHRVLEKRLSQAEYLAGDAYSIADIATYPWLRFPERRGIDFAEFPAVRRWFEAIDARPAVQRGVAVLAENVRKGPMTDAEREVMFGKTQFAAR
jgi:GST-like protein